MTKKEHLSYICNATHHELMNHILIDRQRSYGNHEVKSITKKCKILGLKKILNLHLTNKDENVNYILQRE